MMSFGISSSVRPTASLAAILAMGNPVALLASAELLDTLGFISMTTIRPSVGLRPNWMFEPPHSTPTFRMQAMAAVAHGLVFAVGERLRGGDGDGIARVDSHGVEILDGADDGHVVLEIAHHFKLEFLPAQDAFFQQHLIHRAFGERPGEFLLELLLTKRHGPARTAQREGGALKIIGKPMSRAAAQPLAHRGDDLAPRQVQADLAHRPLEKVPDLPHSGWRATWRR